MLFQYNSMLFLYLVIIYYGHVFEENMICTFILLSHG